MKYYIDSRTMYSYDGIEVERLKDGKISSIYPFVMPTYPSLIYNEGNDLCVSDDGKYIVLEGHSGDNRYIVTQGYLEKYTYEFASINEALLYFSMKYNKIPEETNEWTIKSKQ